MCQIKEQGKIVLSQKHKELTIGMKEKRKGKNIQDDKKRACY